MRSRNTASTVIGIQIMIAMALALGACGSAKPASSAPSGSPTTAERNVKSTTTSATPTTTTTTTPAPALTTTEILTRVSMQPTDLAPGFVTQLYPSGDTVAGQITLELCNATFPSEARRRARHQIGVVEQGGVFHPVTTEATLYDSEAGARQALAELAAAKASCPTGFFSGGPDNEPPMKVAFAAAPDAGWPQTPGITRFAFAFTETDQQGKAISVTEVYQQRGPLLVSYAAVASDRGDAVLAPGGMRAVSHSLALRLAALSPALLNQPSNS